MDSRSYFGFTFEGLWFVCTTLPFGWKIAPYVYHTVSLAASGFLRGVPCSFYLDDRLNGDRLPKALGRFYPLRDRDSFEWMRLRQLYM